MPIGPASDSRRILAVQSVITESISRPMIVDGVYGEDTRAGVAFLQRRLGLPQTGTVDMLTLMGAHARVQDQRRRAEMPRTIEIQMPAEGHQVDAEGPAKLVLTAPTRLFMPRMLGRVGLRGYEPETIAIWLAALQSQPAGLALDVGANVGIFALLAAAQSDRTVMAFEPSPDLAQVARSTAFYNGLDLRVVEVALGDRNGQATLHLSDISDASNSLSPTFRRSTRQVTVEVVTLDAFLSGEETGPAVMKIDTETTESAVLDGARATLERHRPLVICEIVPGTDSTSISALMSTLDYRFHRIGPDDLRVVRDDLVPDTEERNWLFAPDEVSEDFWALVMKWREALDVCGPS